MAKKLPFKFYRRDTETVAQELLGKKLVHLLPDGTRLSGLIVETEAYLGALDAAAHTFGGRRTPRNEVMYGEGGHAYIYFIYGMHYCINAVARTVDQPEAVLIRALECVEGIPTIKKNRPKAVTEKALANGPGKLCQALGIDIKLNGRSLQSPDLFIEDTAEKVSKKAIVASPRIGVDYAGKAAQWPLRFYIKGNPFISKK